MATAAPKQRPSNGAPPQPPPLGAPWERPGTALGAPWERPANPWKPPCGTMRERRGNMWALSGATGALVKAQPIASGAQWRPLAPLSGTQGSMWAINSAHWRPCEAQAGASGRSVAAGSITYSNLLQHCRPKKNLTPSTSQETPYTHIKNAPGEGPGGGARESSRKQVYHNFTIIYHNLP